MLRRSDGFLQESRGICAGRARCVGEVQHVDTVGFIPINGPVFGFRLLRMESSQGRIRSCDTHFAYGTLRHFSSAGCFPPSANCEVTQTCNRSLLRL